MPTGNVFQEKKQIPHCSLGDLFSVPTLLTGVVAIPWQYGEVNRTKQWTLISPWFSCAPIRADLHGPPRTRYVTIHSVFSLTAIYQSWTGTKVLFFVTQCRRAWTWKIIRIYGHLLI